MRAFVFPGQGSQKVGMGVELAGASAAAREVFEEVDDALGQKLSAMMRDGPEDQLTLTENAQPAIMANAIAVLRVLEREGGIALAEKGEAVAGHSLGEYTAFFGLTKARAERLKPDCLIMHPGPINRGVEIDSDIADSGRSVILEQVTNGLATRMAVLFLCAGARSAE